MGKRRYRTIRLFPGDKPGRVLVREHNGEEGFWSQFTQSCTGCFEGGDYMGLAHHYPYDEKARCHVGAGCDECGYTGKRRERWFTPFSMVEVVPAQEGGGRG